VKNSNISFFSTKKKKMVQELQQHTEDFINLSTLAEVTLIAGKLSTTDINEIKNYINKSEDMHVNHSENYHENHHHHHHHLHPKIGYESTKKKWKNNWESTAQRKLHALSSSCSSVSSDDDSTKSLLSYSHKVFDRKKQRSFKQSSTESEYEFHFDTHHHHHHHHHHSSFDAIKNLSCDSSSSSTCSHSDETMRSDESCMKSTNDSMINENEKMTNGEEIPTNDHICPECGKKYSTSE
jgi:hypothetical protein